MNKITATAGLVAIGAASVQAQIYAPEAGSQEATKPWTVSAVLRGFYDDNYTTSPSHLERDSWGFEVSPSAALNLIRDQTALGLSYVYSARWYEDRDDDSWAAIACRHDDDWHALADAIGEPWAKEPAYRELAGRLDGQDELDDQLALWTRQRGRDEVVHGGS